MKIKFIIYLFVIISFSSHAYANVEINTKLKAFGNISISGINTFTSRADLALCKSMILPTHLKGDYGESVVGKYLLEQYSPNGHWTAINSRMGRQGLDLVYLKYDSHGRPRDIMVGEVKYGSSTLGKTKDGVQMGERWTGKRLKALGNRYIRVASSKNMEFKPIPSKLSNNHVIEVDLGNGEKGVFWRENSKSPWKYDGPKDKYETARRNLNRDGRYLKAAGEGRIRIKSSIFEVKVKDGYVTIIHKDAKQVDAGISQAKMKGEEIAHYKVDSSLSKEALTESIAKQIKRKMGHLSDEQCHEIAKDIVDKNSNIEEIELGNHVFAKSVIKNSIRAGIYGAAFTVAIDAIIQAFNGEMNYKRLFESGLIGFGATSVGNAVGQLTTAYISKSVVANGAMHQIASSLGLNTSFLNNIAGSTVGCGVTAILFAYAGYYLGYYDAYTANKIATSGVVGVTGGGLASAATFSLVSTYATAGTGTAISSLSGAAAQNAVLAWLGGGTVASGGGGMAYGASVLGGVVAAVAIATTIATMYCFSLYDQREDNKMMALNLNEYCKGYCFNNESQRIFSN